MKILSSNEVINEWEERDAVSGIYQSFSKKPHPKKSKHKHIYEPVMLECHYKFRQEPFFKEGCRCTLCGKLNYGFPKNMIIEDKNSLPIIPIKDIMDLNLQDM